MFTAAPELRYFFIQTMSSIPPVVSCDAKFVFDGNNDSINSGSFHQMVRHVEKSHRQLNPDHSKKVVKLRVVVTQLDEEINGSSSVEKKRKDVQETSEMESKMKKQRTSSAVNRGEPLSVFLPSYNWRPNEAEGELQVTGNPTVANVATPATYSIFSTIYEWVFKKKVAKSDETLEVKLLTSEPNSPPAINGEMKPIVVPQKKRKARNLNVSTLPIGTVYGPFIFTEDDVNTTIAQEGFPAILYYAPFCGNTNCKYCVRKNVAPKNNN
jgi:hypothetical protein